MGLEMWVGGRKRLNDTVYEHTSSLGIITYPKEQRTWVLVLGRHGDLGAVKNKSDLQKKQRRLFKSRKQKKCKENPPFSGSADAFPSSFTLNSVLGFCSSHFILVSCMNGSHDTA